MDEVSAFFECGVGYFLLFDVLTAMVAVYFCMVIAFDRIYKVILLSMSVFSLIIVSWVIFSDISNDEYRDLEKKIRDNNSKEMRAVVDKYFDDSKISSWEKCSIYHIINESKNIPIERLDKESFAKFLNEER